MLEQPQDAPRSGATRWLSAALRRLWPAKRSPQEAPQCRLLDDVRFIYSQRAHLNAECYQEAGFYESTGAQVHAWEDSSIRAGQGARSAQIIHAIVKGIGSTHLHSHRELAVIEEKLTLAYQAR